MENKSFDQEKASLDEKLIAENGQESILGKMRKISKPVGTVLGFLMLGYGLWTLNKYIKNYDNQEKQPGEASFSIGDAKVDLENWDHMKLEQVDSPIPIESKYLRQMITQQMPIFEREKQGKSMVADEAYFEEFVAEQLSDPVIKELIGDKDLSDISAKEWVGIAAAISIDNLKYDKTTQEKLDSADPEVRNSAGANLAETTDKMSVDQMLAKNADATCRHYATCTKEVFQVLKEKYPEKLLNVFMTRASSYNIDHTWNIVIEVTGPKSAEMSYIDSSAGEWSFEKTFVDDQDFIQLLFNLKESGTIEEDTLFSMAAEYLQKNPDNTKIERFVLTNVPNDLFEKMQIQKMCQVYLSRVTAENKNENTPKVLAALAEIYCDPENFNRTDNWYDQATAVSIMSKSLGYTEVPIPENPEDFYDQKMQDRLASGYSFDDVKSEYEKDIDRIARAKDWAAKHNKLGVWWRKGDLPE